jgi:glycosyltransferase involved in cell wall biosynthesis
MEQETVVLAIGRVSYSRSALAESQDVKTYGQLCQRLRRVYVVALSDEAIGFVRRVGQVIVIGLPQRDGRIRSRLAFVIGAMIVGRRLVRSSGINVTSASDALSGLIAMGLRRSSGVPFVQHVQGQILSLPSAGIGRTRKVLLEQVARLVCRRADLVRCVSRSVVESAERLGISSEKLFYLPPRVDTKTFSTATKHHHRHATRTALGIGESPALLFIGSLTPFKGIDDLCKAFVRVRARIPDVVLVVVGSGPQSAHLHQIAVGLDDPSAVVVVGRVEHARVPELLSVADALVVPSRNEGIPRVILEALAMQVPVVATDVGGVSELIRDEETGLLVPPGDQEKLVLALCKILENREGAARLARRGRSKVQGDYELNSNLDAYATMLRRAARCAS